MPTVSGETKAFWEGCKRGELLIQRCPRCQRYQHYPRAICAHCFSPDIQWVKSSGKGTVWSYTVTHQNRGQGFRDELPYVLALVEVEGGVKMFTNIVDCAPESVKVGLPVEVVFKPATDDITIPYFRPAR
ncbi:MAG: Zn-ribbon domain-containing OB-fold protein [Chloroflexi bacterium]|nr:Zn-ribbon domain-containing OB-fold protein [Chloroflexota bacterium]